MARPTTMMSIALAAAAVAGLLPQVLSPPSPAPAPNVVSLPSGPVSGAPISNPAPPGAGGTATGNTGANSSVGSISGSRVKLVRSGAAQPIRLDWEGAWVRSKALFRNDLGKPLRVTLKMTAQDRLGNAVTAFFDAPKTQGSAGFEIPANSEEVVSLKVRLSPGCGRPLRLPATGFLEAVARPDGPAAPTDPAPVLDTFEVFIPERPVPGTAGYLFAISLLIAGAIVLLIVPRLRSKGVSLLGPMGEPQWSFQQSWGTNVTIASALLVSALSFATFPEHPHLITQKSLSLLLGLFTALVGLAPLAYGLLKRDVQVQVTNPAGASVAGIHSQGYVFMFLLAGGLVLCGALGQAATLLLLLVEFLWGNMIDALIGGILVALAGFLGLLLIVYGWWTLSQIASRPGPAVVSPGGAGPPPPPKPSLRVGSVLSAEDEARLPPPAPEWPLL